MHKIKLGLLTFLVSFTSLYSRADEGMWLPFMLGRNYEEMKADLEARTGLNINRFEIGKIDFLTDTAQVLIFYYADEQEFSDYHV